MSFLWESFALLVLLKIPWAAEMKASQKSKDCACVPQQAEQQGLEGVMWCFSAHRASFSNLQPPLKHWDRAPESFPSPQKRMGVPERGPVGLGGGQRGPHVGRRLSERGRQNKAGIGREQGLSPTLLSSSRNVIEDPQDLDEP